MAYTTVIKIGHEESAATISALYTPGDGTTTQVGLQLNLLTNWINALIGNERIGSVDIQVAEGAGVRATGKITLSSFAAADTITVAGQTFTASASPSGNNQFLSTGGDTAVAAAAVVKINAHPSLSDVVTASSTGAVITITCTKLGIIGNLLGIAISAHGSVSAATLGSGTGATAGVNTVANTFVCGRLPV